jgi:hypothetical protein
MKDFEKEKKMQIHAGGLGDGYNKKRSFWFTLP